MKFIDEAKVYATAGNGGNGVVAWRREKYVPKGGPAGGDGGNGGSIIFTADESVHSLLDLHYRPHIKAEHGEPGSGKSCYGKAGKDVVVRVPVGTEIFDDDTGERLADLVNAGDRVVVCEGGSGGFGNARFVSSTRQAPDFAKPGLEGEDKVLRVSLKVLADVGLLGFPNAGKSTLLSVLSAARPRIADYPFTTLTPNLGVVAVEDMRTFVIADIPGLIEGASEGAGLGYRFLKHLERVKALCHIVELRQPYEGAEHVDLVTRYRTLRGELQKYSEELAALPEVVVVNKVDLFADVQGGVSAHPEVIALREEIGGAPLLLMSAATKTGVDEVRFALWNLLSAERDREEEAVAARLGGGGFDPLAKERLR